MLWDMDGGLLPLLKAGGARQQAALDVLESALRLGSPMCIYSALHGLGHGAYYQRGLCQGAVDRFLIERGAALSPFLARYAQAARAGGVQ